MAILNIQFFQCMDRLYTSESDVYRHQILTDKDCPRAGRVNKKCFSDLLLRLSIQGFL